VVSDLGILRVHSIFSRADKYRNERKVSHQGRLATPEDARPISVETSRARLHRSVPPRSCQAGVLGPFAGSCSASVDFLWVHFHFTFELYTINHLRIVTTLISQSSSAEYCYSSSLAVISGCFAAKSCSSVHLIHHRGIDGKQAIVIETLTRGISLAKIDQCRPSLPTALTDTIRSTQNFR